MSNKWMIKTDGKRQCIYQIGDRVKFTCDCCENLSGTIIALNARDSKKYAVRLDPPASPRCCIRYYLPSQMRKLNNE